MQNISNSIGWNSVHISDIFNYCSANINDMWNTRKLGGIQNIWIHTNLKHTTCKYRVTQHLIVLNLCSVSINKILVIKSKSIAKSRRVQNKWTNHKIFELKHANKIITR